jgi:hypothetical protein
MIRGVACVPIARRSASWKARGRPIALLSRREPAQVDQRRSHAPLVADLAEDRQAPAVAILGLIVVAQRDGSIPQAIEAARDATQVSGILPSS